MAPAVPTVIQSDFVRIRICSLELGTTRWKEGSFEIRETDGKTHLWVKFNCGGPPKIFQLRDNVKNVVLGPVQSLVRLVLTLKNASVTFDRVPVTLAKKMKEYLEKLKEGKPAVLKTTQGSASFGILGKRLPSNESSPHTASVERRAKPRREVHSPLQSLGSPSRITSTPKHRGLSENRSETRKRPMVSEAVLDEDYPKENDSSSNNKASLESSQRFLLSCKEKLKQSEENRSAGPVALQTSSFYSGRSATRDYSQGSFLERPKSTSQSPSSRKSLTFPSHSTPFKRICPGTDYSGWNRPRPSALAVLQPPLQGFSNLGNTCYMNAILQSLFSLQSFSNDLLKHGVLYKKIPVNALLRRFVLLLLKKDTSTPEMKRDLLRRVKSAISSTAERFSGYMQNDAHEFLSQCLDQLKDDVEKVNKTLKKDPWEGPQGVRPGGQLDAARVYTCPVVANMEFEVQHTITCKGCGRVLTKREQFNDLSIDLPRSAKTLPLRSIQDSLDLFFRMEEIEYSCESCSGKSATVTHKFSKLPRVLILHLKRYSYNAQLCLNSKLGQQVFIPKYLSLLAHCTDSTRPPLCLGWSPQSAAKTPLKPDSSIRLDSDSEEEVTRKTASGRRRLCLGDEVEKVVSGSQPEPLDNSGIGDDELLAAVLEMSRQDAPRSQNEPSSPDTGFGDADIPDHSDAASPDMLGENKENETPWGLQEEMDFSQQEKEERELQMALAQSLQENEAREMEEENDLKKATELSLQEFNRSVTELLCSADDSGNEEAFVMDYSEAEAEELNRNAETGEMANSFRLVSVVSHIGSSSSSGHYVSDVYDMKKQSWLTYNDLDVSRTQESAVQKDRDRSGYIFFYMQRELFEELERKGGSGDFGRAVLQPL